MNFPHTRLRRLRVSHFMRTICAETHLNPQQLIYPIFVHEQKGRVAIDALPGQYRHDIDSLLETIEQCLEAGIALVALFPVIDAGKKNKEGLEALNAAGLIPRCIRSIQDRYPEMGLMADVALDPYTDHGHDGVLDQSGRIDNDRTITVLANQALILAQAGVGALAPSDMMDGRVKVIRAKLEDEKYIDTAIIAYSAKYASSFYGPFRAAIDAGNQLGQDGKRSYQMDPSCRRQAIAEGQLDIAEGADALIVKPAMPYLDIVADYRARFVAPLFAYQVSGEYTMLKLLAEHSQTPLSDLLMESLIGIKRAGADCILSYFALEAAKICRQHP